MTDSMTVLSAQTGLNNTDVVALTEKMNLLSESTGLTTEEIVAQTAEQYNLTEQTDLLRRAYESQKGANRGADLDDGGSNPRGRPQ
jgi:hypothetical protein